MPTLSQEFDTQYICGSLLVPGQTKPAALAHSGTTASDTCSVYGFSVCVGAGWWEGGGGGGVNYGDLSNFGTGRSRFLKHITPNFWLLELHSGCILTGRKFKYMQARFSTSASSETKHPEAPSQ